MHDSTPYARHPQPPSRLTMERIFEVIASHVTPIQALAIVESLEALEEECGISAPLPPGADD